MAAIIAAAVVTVGLLLLCSSCYSASSKSDSNGNSKKAGMEEMLPLMYMMMNGATPLNTPTVWVVAVALVATLALVTNNSIKFMSAGTSGTIYCIWFRINILACTHAVKHYFVRANIVLD